MACKIPVANDSRMFTRLLAFACISACASSPRPEAATAASPAASTSATQSTSAQMRDHFADATAARDAVIAGRLQDVRPPLGRLANAPDARDLPNDWLPWFDEMRNVAARGAQATTLASAADSVAALGATCGECHRATRGGPREALAPEYYSRGERGIPEKMARHRFAADELWFGLTGPVHQAWSAGASALMNINVPSLVTHRGDPASDDRQPSGEGTLQGEPDPQMPAQERDETETERAPSGTVALDPALRELRALGERADRASIVSDKQQVFAEMIAKCGTCHARVGVRP